MPFFHKKFVEAKLIGPNLVAAFHNANPPLVWKFDLERNHSFTVALQGEEGDWELGITSPKGEFYPVAHFSARENAEEALAQVQKILMKKRRSKLWCVFKFFLILLVLGVVMLVGGGYFMVTNVPKMMSFLPSATTMMVAPPAAIPEIPSGVPLPADQVLKVPQ